MNFQDVIKKRKSIRSFQETEVPSKILEEVITLANFAPSAGAIKGYKWFLTKEKFGNVNAPIYLIICTNPQAYILRYGDRGKDLYSIQDATIFGAYIQLILVDKEIDSCWIGSFRESKVKQALHLEEYLKPIAIIAIGYANNI